MPDLRLIPVMIPKTLPPNGLHRSSYNRLLSNSAFQHRAPGRGSLAIGVRERVTKHQVKDEFLRSMGATSVEIKVSDD